jgi:predicted permease
VWDTIRAAAAEWSAALGDIARPDPARSRGEIMSSFLGDVRFALRQVAHRPAHGLTVVLLMTLGIAGNTAVFRIVDGLFLKPLPFEDPEQLVDLDETAPQWNLEYVGISYQDFVEWRQDNRSFDAMAVWTGGGANLSDGVSAERVSYVRASHDLDDVLEIAPDLGRFFTEAEDTPDGADVALLTRDFWESYFASDPEVLGTTLSLDGTLMEVIGVLPRRADFVDDADVWLPLKENADENHGWYLTGIGRLRPGVSMQQAREDLLAIHRGMIPERDVNQVTSPVLHTLHDRYLGSYRASTGFLLGAVAIVLLIACANIAGLLIARSLERGQEIGIRLAMGAPRGRIVRQLLTESALLALVGAVAGAALGIWGSGRLVGRLSEQFPSWVVFDLDASVLGFALILTAGAVVLFGLAPALHAAGMPIASLAGAGRSTASARRRRILSGLVGAEVALAVALLVVGCLSMLDAWRVGRIDPGFTTEDITVYRLDLPGARYAEGDALVTFVDRYLEALRAIPDVEAATVANVLPLLGHWGTFYEVEGAPPRAEGEQNPVVLNRVVTPGYFATMGVRLAAGRAFDDFDGRSDSLGVAIVNETFVRTHMSDGKNPVGRRISSGGDPAIWLTVIGVTHDVKHYALDEPMRPGVYVPFSQEPLWGLQVALRTAPGANSPLAAARSVTAELDPGLAIYGEQTMTSVLNDSLWARRATSWLIGAFSTVALLLAVAGLYGVISYSVTQRAREISVRMAMGAEAAQVRRAVVREGMAVVGAGIVVGVGAVLALSGAVGHLLSQVRPTEPWVYAVVCVLLAAVGAAANWIPARRAAATDPMAVLRAE